MALPEEVKWQGDGSIEISRLEQVSLMTKSVVGIWIFAIYGIEFVKPGGTRSAIVFLSAPYRDLKR